MHPGALTIGQISRECCVSAEQGAGAGTRQVVRAQAVSPRSRGRLRPPKNPTERKRESSCDGLLLRRTGEPR